MRPAAITLIGVAASVTVAGCGSSAPVVRPATSGATGSTVQSRSSAPPSSRPSSPVHPSVVVTPSRQLPDRRTVTVQARGFSPGEALQVVECAAKGTSTGPGDCNLTAMLSVVADATGAVATRLPVVRGPFGSNKVVCGATVRCLVSVTQASLAPTEEADAAITFATG